jgi:hypothetical protein
VVTKNIKGLVTYFDVKLIMSKYDPFKCHSYLRPSNLPNPNTKPFLHKVFGALFLSWIPTFEWYMATLVVINGQQKDICHDE